MNKIERRNQKFEEAVILANSLATLPQKYWGAQEQIDFEAVARAAKPAAFRQAKYKGWNCYLQDSEITQAAAEAAWEAINYLRRNHKEAEAPLFSSILSQKIADALELRGSAELGQRHGRCTRRKAYRVRQLQEAGFTPEEIQAKLNISQYQFEAYLDASYDYDGGIRSATAEEERRWAEELVAEVGFDRDLFWRRSYELICAAVAAGNLPYNAPDYWELRENHVDATLKEMGSWLCISYERVRQIHEKIIDFLKKNIDKLVDWD